LIDFFDFGSEAINRLKRYFAASLSTPFCRHHPNYFRQILIPGANKVSLSGEKKHRKQKKKIFPRSLKGQRRKGRTAANVIFCGRKTVAPKKRDSRRKTGRCQCCLSFTVLSASVRKGKLECLSM
jgi:hypothetical protein